MKVCIDGRLLDLKKNTGISRYTEFIVEYYLNRGYEVSLIVNKLSNSISNCSIIQTELQPYNMIDFYRYPKLIDSITFDILHIPFYSGLAKKLKAHKGKVIITTHDLMYRLVDNFFGNNKLLNRIKRRYINHIVGLSMNNADMIISVSSTTHNDIERYFKKPSIVIPEHSEISSNFDDSILTKFSLTSKGYYLYCGNNRPHKNISFIREIFNNYNLDAPLVLAGSGHSNGSNIISTGIISDGELRSLYKNAKAFIFPSSYEGFGLPILEALYCNTPVICSNIPAFREFKNSNIIYYEVNDVTSFLKAVYQLKEKQYLPDNEFFKNYSRDNIYRLLDKEISNICQL